LLCEEIQDECHKYSELYKRLRTERRAKQHAHQRKTVLENKIDVLEEAGRNHHQQMNDLENQSKHVLDDLMKTEKINTTLRKQLDNFVEHNKSDMNKAYLQLNATRDKLKGIQGVVSKLCKRCNQATAKHENALIHIKQKILKDKAFHNLLEKGIYSQKTRELVCTLVNAGCAQGQVSGVIHAVLKVAGITTVGDISRRSVSRIIDEGYIAACMQLGKEIQETKGRFFSLLYIKFSILKILLSSDI
jgi:hypothetical protein